MRPAVAALAGLAISCSIAACDFSGDDAASHRVERDERGDTTFVRNVPGSVPTPLTLVEELRIGSLDGAAEQVFGRVALVVADGAGGVYVFDNQAQELRHFDDAGNYTHTIGRAGEGPGEFRQVFGAARRSDDRILVYDLGNARINVYEPDGAVVDHWPVEPSLATSQALVLDTADHMYIRMMMEQPQHNQPWRVGLFHLDDDGVLIDTIPDPSFPGEPEIDPGSFDARKMFARVPLGGMIVGVSSSYSFDRRRPDGSVLRVELATGPIAFLADERAGFEARNEWIRRNQGQFLMSDIPPVPAVKPAYREIIADQDGRVWVRPFVEGIPDPPDPDVEQNPTRAPPAGWTEPVVYDLFANDGAYIGRLPVPPRTTITPSAGDEIWGVVRGEFDEQYVVRFRLSTG